MADNNVTTVLGRKGSGKTTLIGEIIAEYERVVAIDWNGEYQKFGCRTVEGAEACSRALVDASGQTRYKLALIVPRREEAFRLMGIIGKMKRTLVVVDEASVYCSPSFLPDELAMLVRLGRHNELSQVYAARRPSELNRDLTAQSDLIVTFQQQEPRDLDYLRAVMGPEGDNARTLGKYEILVSGDMAKAPLAVLSRVGKKPTRRKKVDTPPEGADPPSEGANSA